MMPKNKDPYSVTCTGLSLIGVLALMGYLAVFYFLSKAGIPTAELIQIFVVSVAGLVLVGYAIAVGLRSRQAAEIPVDKPVFSRRTVLLLRLFALPCLALVFVMMYDLAAPSMNDGKAVVLSKYKGAKGSPRVKISEYGIERSHEIGRREYRIIQQGDTLRFTRSKIFKNWRDVSVTRNDKKILEFNSRDDLGMLVVSLILAVPILSFFIPISGPAPTWVKGRELMILVVVPTIEFIVITGLGVYFFRWVCGAG